MRKMKIKENVTFTNKPSQTNALIKSSLGSKSLPSNRRISKKPKSRAYVASSDIAPPSVPPTVSQKESINVSSRNGEHLIPPYQNPRKSNTGNNLQITNSTKSYSNHREVIPSFHEGGDKPAGYKHYSSDFREIPFVQGDGVLSSKHQRYENTPFVPASDPISNQEYLELQKVHRVKQKRYITMNDKKRMRAAMELQEEKERKMKEPPPTQKFQSFNNVNLLRTSRRNAEVQHDKIVEIKKQRLSHGRRKR